MSIYTFGRYTKSLCLAEGSIEGAIALASSQGWLDVTPVIRLLERAAVQGLDSTDIAASEVGRSFLEALRPVSVLQRLPSRRVPANVRTIAFGTGSVGSVVAEGAAKKLTLSSIAGVTVTPRVTVALNVITAELLRHAGPEAEAAIASDVAGAVGAAEDVAVLDPSITGSLLNGSGVGQRVSAGATLANADADLVAAIGLLIAGGSTLQAAHWAMHPTTAVKLAAMRGTGGNLAYPGIGARGGELLGLPVLVSASISGYIALLDADGILIAEDGPMHIDIARSATVEMSDTPSANSIAGTPTQAVSLFQTNSICVRAEISRGWYRRPNSTAIISGVAY